MTTRFHNRHPIALALALALLASSVSVFTYSKVREDQRKVILARLSPGEFKQTILLGDSIARELTDINGRTLNLAVAGVTSKWVMENQLRSVNELSPGRVVIAIGINDLRYGQTPEECAASISELASMIMTFSSEIEVIVMAILPVVAGTDLAGDATLDEISETNKFLKEKAKEAGFGFVDHSSLFSKGNELRTELSSDGLHLSEQGVLKYEQLLFHGLVGFNPDQARKQPELDPK